MISIKADALPALTAIELEHHVTVKEAAKIKGLSQDTFERHYRHIIKKASERRCNVKLRDLLTAEPRKTAA
jgi:hypothetical protein